MKENRPNSPTDGSAVGVLILSLPANTFKVQQLHVARSLRSTALASFFPSFIVQSHPFVDQTQTLSLCLKQRQ